MAAYYNENEPFCVEWLRNLIGKGLIADGEVDARDTREVRPEDVRGFDQAHLFAGIGGWSHALRLAGWPDDRPVWTGSCPCQPFSVAGKREGAGDERHLWPAWSRLIVECAPSVVFGEQVGGAVGHGWLDAVFADLETEGYTCGAVVLPACSVGAPHIRQRLWFVADRECQGLEVVGEQQARRQRATIERGGAAVELGDAAERGLREGFASRRGRIGEGNGSADAGRLGDADIAGGGRHTREVPRAQAEGSGKWRESGRLADEPVAPGNPWDPCDWLPCRDGKARPVEPGTFPLAHGVPGRVGRLRAYGNAIVPQVAAEVIAAYMECRP